MELETRIGILALVFGILAFSLIVEVDFEDFSDTNHTHDIELYMPSQVTILNGTLISGNLAAAQLHDYKGVTVRETANGLKVRMNYTNIPSFNDLNFIGRFISNQSNESINIEILNRTNYQYDNMCTIYPSIYNSSYFCGFPDMWNYISNGNVSVVFNSTHPGNISNFIYADVLTLRAYDIGGSERMLVYNYSEQNNTYINGSQVDNSSIQINISQVNYLSNNLSLKVNKSGDINITGTFEFNGSMLFFLNYTNAKINLQNNYSNPVAFAVTANRTNQNSVNFISYTGNTSSTGMDFRIRSSRGNPNNPVQSQAGDLLGSVTFQGMKNDSSFSSVPGGIFFYTYENVSSSGTGSFFELKTTTNATTSSKSILKIDSAGIQLSQINTGITMYSPNGNAYCTTVTNAGALQTLSGACT